jgi:malonyl CoA-acyl carrier protein transacylase
VISEQQIAELKSKHGPDLVLVPVGDADLVFRKPTRHEYDRWFDKMQVDKGSSSAHAREMAQATLVHPGKDELSSALDAQPGMLTTTIIDAITDLAGLGAKSAVKKL